MATSYFPRAAALAAIAAVLLFGPAAAQLITSDSVAKVSIVHGQTVYPAGESFRLLFKLEIAPGWHTQSHAPSMEGLIATRLQLTADKGIAFGRVAYPQPVMERFAFSPDPLSVFRETVYIGVTGTVPPDAVAGEAKAQATLTVQACDDKSCLAPSDLALEFPMALAAAGTAAERLNAETYNQQSGLFDSGGPREDVISAYLQSGGLMLALAAVFAGGLALNLTPCVYPLIPITVSYFAGQAAGGRAALLIRALLYLLGMAAMYSALGVAAALTGSLFGALLAHWAVILALAGLMVALALSMFGVYELRLPAALAQAGGENRTGALGALVMGLTAGIIAAPCVGPFVIGLLTFVGERGDPALGFLLFFTLALGLGLPFVALALFSGAVNFLPRSGVWMIWVRQVFGFILLGMALYFAQPLIPERLYLPLSGIFGVAAGLWLGWLSKVRAPGRSFMFIRAAVGLAAIGAGAVALAQGFAPEREGIAWEKASIVALERAAREGKPVVVDATADWCLPCKELEVYTFSDPVVIEAAKGFVMLKADYTTGGDEEAAEVKRRLAAIGVPTLVFIGPDGAERAALRAAGFVTAGGFAEKMKRAQE